MTTLVIVRVQYSRSVPLFWQGEAVELRRRGVIDVGGALVILCPPTVDYDTTIVKRIGEIGTGFEHLFSQTLRLLIADDSLVMPGLARCQILKRTTTQRPQTQ